MVKGLKAPMGLTINFKPSPRQYEMWKLLQPNCCPHCGVRLKWFSLVSMKGANQNIHHSAKNVKHAIFHALF